MIYKEVWGFCFLKFKLLLTKIKAFYTISDVTDDFVSTKALAAHNYILQNPSSHHHQTLTAFCDYTRQETAVPAKVIKNFLKSRAVFSLWGYVLGIFVAWIFLLAIIFFHNVFLLLFFLIKTSFYFHLLVYNYVLLYHVFYGYDGFIQIVSNYFFHCQLVTYPDYIQIF